MITLDKYVKMEASLFIPLEEEANGNCFDVWETDRRFDRLDSIRIVGTEFDRLVAPLENMTEKSTELLSNPALPEFELEVCAPVPMVGKNTIRYKKTALPQEPQRMIENEKLYMDGVPMIDAYISFTDPGRVDYIMTIMAAYYYSHDGKLKATGSLQQGVWKRKSAQLDEMLTAQGDYLEEYKREMRLIYLAIQRAMRNKPEVFSETSGMCPGKGSENKGKRSRRNKAFIVRRITMNSEELKKYSTPQRHMSCPCWGVMGHWRRYKSGKQIWIEPYRKGKDRDNPAAYTPKDYSFVQEGEAE